MEDMKLMDNAVTSSCRIIAGKIICKARSFYNDRDRKITLSDGGKVVIGNLSVLKRKGKKKEEMFRQFPKSMYKTNICRTSSLAVKTQARDYVLESMLQSGKFTFDNMYVIRNPYGESPLTALALFKTEKKCKVRVTTKGKTDDVDYVSILPASKIHRVPILALYPDMENKVLIELLDEQDKSFAGHMIPIRTKKIPEYMCDCISVKKKAESPAFPMILINGGVDIHTCAFDKEGDIRFYLRRKPRGYGIFPLQNGCFIYMEKDISTPSFTNPQTVQSHEMDYFGRVFKTYHTKNGVHHTVEEKRDGNIIAGSNTMLEHTEDKVIEIDRKTGEIVWELCIGDLFDDTYKNWVDWAHVNSAAYYEKDSSMIVSLRNIHSVICVDYHTKKLRWLLADPKFWEGTAMTEYLLKPVGEVPWIYQQHAAYEIDEGLANEPGIKHIMIYDNHWAKRRKAASFDNDTMSYVSFYDVNESEMTVSLYKRFAGPKARIRSNGIYVPEKKRVYNMAGCFPEPVDGDMGAVIEYEFESGEVLSEYGVKPGFFRAYNFAPDIIELAKPMEYSSDYFAGELRYPELTYDELNIKLGDSPDKSGNADEIKCRLQEDILLVEATDHQLQKIYLCGIDDNYVVDYSDTYQTKEVFSTMVYEYTAHLKNLPAGYYDLYLVVNNKLTKTGKYIIKK